MPTENETKQANIFLWITSLAHNHRKCELNLKKIYFCVADPGSGSGMNNPGHISESLKKFFGLNSLNYFMRIRDGKNRIRDPGWKNSDPDPGSATLIYLNFLQNFNVV
jgi:hypothetical protein